MMSAGANSTLYTMVMRPLWHGLLLLGGLLLLVIILFYHGLLQEQWQWQQQHQQQISQLHEQRYTTEQHLVNTPDLARIQQALQPAQSGLVPLQRQVALALKGKSVRVLGWVPATASAAAESQSASQLTLHSDYRNLLGFLASLLTLPQAPRLQSMTIRQGQEGIDVVIGLAERQNGLGGRVDQPLALVNGDRDPFNSVNVSDCAAGTAGTSAFYLAGMVQSDAKQSGWLFWPDGHWQKVSQGDTVLNTFWFVERLQPRQLLLRNRQQGCEEHTLLLEVSAR